MPNRDCSEKTWNLNKNKPIPDFFDRPNIRANKPDINTGFLYLQQINLKKIGDFDYDSFVRKRNFLFFGTVSNKLFLSIPLLIAWILFVGCQPVKTKSTLDRLYELDPSGKVFISSNLKASPPATVAILPFHSIIGEGRIEGSRFLFNLLTGRKASFPESVSEKMRRAFWGQFAQLEFNLVKRSHIDRILKKEGIDSWEKFRSLPPQRLGELLGAEALIFGQVTHFDYYYGFLYSQLAVGLSMEMLDSKTGEILWRVQDARRDHTVRMVFDPLGLLVGLFQAGFALRPINMMRAMDEISRELVGTIPAPSD